MFRLSLLFQTKQHKLLHLLSAVFIFSLSFCSFHWGLLACEGIHWPTPGAEGWGGCQLPALGKDEGLKSSVWLTQGGEIAAINPQLYITVCLSACRGATPLPTACSTAQPRAEGPQQRVGSERIGEGLLGSSAQQSWKLEPSAYKFSTVPPPSWFLNLP